MLSLFVIDRNGRHCPLCGLSGIFVLSIMFSLLFGCTQREEITSYRVRKPEQVDPTLVSTASTANQPATDQQTIGLIVPVSETGWFFKLTGEAKAVEPQHEAFLEFVQSIKFSPLPDAKPSWKLPENWKELAGREMRYATIQIPAEPKPLELSVIPLPTGAQDQQKYVLDNVNRWRQQLKLPAITAGDLENTTNKLKVDGHDATLVSLVGKGSGQMGGAPFAPFAGGSAGALPADHPPLSSPGDRANAKNSATGGLKFDAPSGWSPSKPNAFSLAAFKVVDGDKQVEITVSTAGGDFVANANRWRGQLKLPPVDSAELAKSASKIDTLGTSADYIEVVGPDSAHQETILGVQAEAGGRTWFVKLKGDAELAEREKPRFEAFVKSLKLP